MLNQIEKTILKSSLSHMVASVPRLVLGVMAVARLAQCWTSVAAGLQARQQSSRCYQFPVAYINISISCKPDYQA